MQKTAYERRISDWSSDVCSSDLPDQVADRHVFPDQPEMLHSLHALRAQGSGPVVITTAIFRDDVGGSLERPMRRGERKSVVSGKSVSVRVELGGRRDLKTKKTTQRTRNAARHDKVLKYKK